MEVRIAENAGFCFGVKRAMNMAWYELENNNNNYVYSLGPLIHNKQAVDRYKEKGLLERDSLDKIPSSSKLIIRSHGVAESYSTSFTKFKVSKKSSSVSPGNPTIISVVIETW